MERSWEVSRQPGWNVLPLSSLPSRPLLGVQLHCLPSSSYTAEAKSHPSGLEFGLIYRHQSLFVRMSYGLTLLVCSFVVITKAITVTGKLPLNWHTATSLFQKDIEEVALYTATTPISNSSTYPPAVKSLWTPWHLNRVKQKGLDPNMRVLLMDLEYVFLTLVHSVFIFLE